MSRALLIRRRGLGVLMASKLGGSFLVLVGSSLYIEGNLFLAL